MTPASATLMLEGPLPGRPAEGRFDLLWTLLPAAFLAQAWTWITPAHGLVPPAVGEALAALTVAGLAAGTFALEGLWAREQGLAPRRAVARRGWMIGALALLPALMLGARAGTAVAAVQWFYLLAACGFLAAEALAAGRRTAFTAPAAQPAAHPWRDCLTLAKPGLNSLVVVTTAVGYFMASGGELDWLRFVGSVAATAMVAGGASALNQFTERTVDQYMPRTARRPLPAGRMTPARALRFGAATSIAGLAALAIAGGPAAAFLAALTLAVYVYLYTPLKRINTLSTLAGGVSGALPPMIGWAAAQGGLAPGAWILFSILFLWQIPHFLAIAWRYREQYGAAGMPMYSVLDAEGRATGLQTVLYGTALLLVSVLPSRLGLTGWLYGGGAALLGLMMLGCAIAFTARPRRHSSMRLFFASILYLPLLLGLMVIDRFGHLPVM